MTVSAAYIAAALERLQSKIPTSSELKETD